MPRPKGLPKTGGNKKGSKHKATLERENFEARARETYIGRIAQKVAGFADRQVAIAEGDDARLALQAITDALDRLIGKANQTVTHGVEQGTGSVTITYKLRANARD